MKKRLKTMQVLVTFRRMPAGVGTARVTDYVRHAVRNWSGCYAPDDPLRGEFANASIEGASVSTRLPETPLAAIQRRDRRRRGRQ